MTTAKQPSNNEIKQAAEGIIKQLPELLKTGYKTTEFWITLVYEALILTSAVPLPGAIAKAIASAVGVLGYVISRGIAKHGAAAAQADFAHIVVHSSQNN